jgi:hypothetical protein
MAVQEITTLRLRDHADRMDEVRWSKKV